MSYVDFIMQMRIAKEMQDQSIDISNDYSIKKEYVDDEPINDPIGEI